MEFNSQDNIFHLQMCYIAVTGVMISWTLWITYYLKFEYESTLLLNSNVGVLLQYNIMLAQIRGRLVNMIFSDIFFFQMLCVFQTFKEIF